MRLNSLRIIVSFFLVCSSQSLLNTSLDMSKLFNAVHLQHVRTVRSPQGEGKRKIKKSHVQEYDKTF